MDALRRRLLLATLAAALLAGVVLLPGPASAESSGGAQLWITKTNGPGYRPRDSAKDIAISPDGTRVFTTGYFQQHLSGPAYLTVAYDARTGRQLWSATFDRMQSYETATSIGLSPDGSVVFVTGTAVIPEDDYVTFAYDAATGQTLWSAAYRNSSPYEPFLAVDPLGRAVFVAGGIADAQFRPDYLVIAYDQRTGNELWSATAGSPPGYDLAAGVSVDPSGKRVYVTGQTEGRDGYNHFATLAYNPLTGDRLWLARLGTPGPLGSSVPSAIGASPDGTALYVTGQGGARSPGNPKDFFLTVAYDAASGTKKWAAATEPLPLCCGDEPRALATSPDGEAVYVTGEAGEDYLTIRYDAATGTELWSTSYDGPEGNRDSPQDIGVDASGSMVVATGLSLDARSWDWATVAYDASAGRQIRVVRFNDRADNYDAASALAMHPTEPVAYVTGGSYVGYDTTIDMTTIAYVWV